MSNRAQTIQIFLPDGNPNSVKIAELTNRIIYATYIPRNKLDEIGKREETKNSGVYYLFGTNEDKAKPSVYIGESDDCFDRLKQHYREKEFWNCAVIVTSKTNTFTKSHAKFLEYYSLKKAITAERYDIENFNQLRSENKEPKVTEVMKADLLDNFDTIKVLLSTLGYPLFEEIQTETNKSNPFIYRTGKATAYGNFIGESFVIYQGSTANNRDNINVGNWVKTLKQKLIDDKIIIQNGDIFEFASDYVFNSPSAAAAVVLGGSVNGWTAWKNNEGKTIDQILRINVGEPLEARS